jgi:hypothetical protein
MTTLKYEVNESGTILRNDQDGKVWSIPADLANSDYQRYLAWLENPEAEQSTPIVINEAETI